SRLASGSLAVAVAPTLGVATIDTGGTVTAADDRIVYRPGTDLGGDDRFDYRLCDNDGNCSVATVTLVVRPHAGITLGSDSGAGYADVVLSGLRAMPDAVFAANGPYGSAQTELAVGVDPTPETPWDLD